MIGEHYKVSITKQSDGKWLMDFRRSILWWCTRARLCTWSESRELAIEDAISAIGTIKESSND